MYDDRYADQYPDQQWRKRDEIAYPNRARAAPRARGRSRKTTLTLYGLASLAVVIVIATGAIILPATQNSPKTSVPPQLLLSPGTLTWGGDPTLGPPWLSASTPSPTPQPTGTVKASATGQPTATTALPVAGLEADLMQALAQRLHVKLAFTPVQWQQFPQALQSRKVDVFSGGIEADTVPKNAATFTAPYLIISDEIVVRAGDTRFTTLASLANHTIAVLAGDRALKTAQTISGATIITDTELPFVALATGRVDAVVISSPIARSYVANDTTHSFAILPVEANPAPIALALPVGGATTLKLRDLISTTLHSMATDGSLAAIVQRWHMDSDLQACVTAAHPPASCPAL